MSVSEQLQTLVWKASWLQSRTPLHQPLWHWMAGPWRTVTLIFSDYEVKARFQPCNNFHQSGNHPKKGELKLYTTFETTYGNMNFNEHMFDPILPIFKCIWSWKLHHPWNDGQNWKKECWSRQIQCDNPFTGDPGNDPSGPDFSWPKQKLIKHGATLCNPSHVGPGSHCSSPSAQNLRKRPKLKKRKL